jgi:hypothetical protein
MREPQKRRMERAAREAADHRAAAKAVRDLVERLQRLIARGVRL